jgi:hypothetical protein
VENGDKREFTLARRCHGSRLRFSGKKRRLTNVLLSRRLGAFARDTKKTSALLNDVADEPICAASVGGRLVHRRFIKKTVGFSIFN